MDEKSKLAASHEKIRINKLLSDAGVCSRREADRLIEQGKITVYGKTVTNGEKFSADAVICLDGKPVTKQEKRVLLLFNKPKGLVCSTKQQKQETTVIEYLKYPMRIYPVGRLDKDSQGLLLLTNQGELVNKIMRAGNYHEKEYVVTVDHPVTKEFLHKMEKGVPILDTVTRPCVVRQTGKNTFSIILTQGLNRQIRRMCTYLGYEVRSLKRVRIMNLVLGSLKEGQYREITGAEQRELLKRIQSSSNETVIKGKNEAGGKYGNSHTANERTGRQTKAGIKGVLSGRPGNHEQSGVRRTVRRASETGRGNRNRSGK